jgi:hypothetical protein
VIEVLKDYEFDIAEAKSNFKFIKERKKYIISPVMNWDQQGTKGKIKKH